MNAPYRPRHIAPLDMDTRLWDQPRPRPTFVDEVEEQLHDELRDAALLAFLGLACGVIVAMILFFWWRT